VVVVDVVDGRGRGAPLHVGDRFTIGEDVLVDRIPLNIIQLKRVSCRRAVGPKGDALVVNVAQIACGRRVELRLRLNQRVTTQMGVVVIGVARAKMVGVAVTADFIRLETGTLRTKEYYQS